MILLPALETDGFISTQSNAPWPVPNERVWAALYSILPWTGLNK